MNLMYDLRLFFDEIATFLLSPECFLCGEKLDTYKVVLCDNCVQGLERYRNPFCLMCGKEIRDGKIICCGDSPVEFVFAVGNYKMGWGRLVEAFKLQRQVALKEFLSRELAGAILNSGFFDGFEYIIPVPTSGVKLRERGYSQTLLLAKEVSKLTGIRLIADGARRVKFKRSQIGLGRDERIENVKGTFGIVDDRIPENGNIIILDDVMTTGSTLKEFCGTLRRKANGRIAGLVVARA